MNKVIYISTEPLTKQISKSFFIPELIQNGISVEYWDLSIIYSHHFAITDQVNLDIVVKIHNKNEVKNRIVCEDIEHTIFIPSAPYEWDTLWLYRLFTKCRCHTAFFGRGSLPFPAKVIGVDRVNQIIKRVMSGEVVNIWKGFLNRVASQISAKGFAKKYDVVFTVGRQAILRYKVESQIIEVNHFDFDQYFSLKGETTKLVNGRYAVFLDTNMPFHPGWHALKMKTISPINYFRGLNQFFDLVEKKWGIRIIIAAHPTSDYEESIFHRREIFKYKTNELVKDCEFVISQISTSVSCAVLNEKPILSLYSNGIKDCGPKWVFPFIENLAKVVGGVLYNVDEIHSEDQIRLPKVDSNLYEKYKYDYLTSPQSENSRTKDIFLDFLRNG